MNGKTVLLIALGVFAGACIAFSTVFLMMPQFSYMLLGIGAPQPQGYAPGYGRGMMGGYNNAGTPSAPGTPPAGYGPGGMMGRGGMMGGYNNAGTPSAPGTPPAYGPGGMMGRGGMMGQGQPPSGTAPNAPQASGNSVQMNADTASQKVGYTNVTLTLAPYPPMGFRQSTFDITLTDDKGAAVQDAKVSFNLTMPAMWMPSNKPIAQAIGDGKYRATGMFTMRGWWRIEVIIERGGEKQSAFFELSM